MKKIRCLYVEDDPVHQGRFGLSIEQAWKGQGTGVDIEVVTVDSPENALKRLSEDEFHLLVVDLLYKEKGQRKGSPRGLQLISTVKKDPAYADRLGVIALSLEGELAPDANRFGADEFLTKGFIDGRDPDFQHLGAVLRKVLAKMKYDPRPSTSSDIRFDTTDLRLRWLVENVGQDTIAALVSRLLKPSKMLDIGFVRGGLSGASVIRVDCDFGDTTPIRKILLKITQTRPLLDKELANLADAKFPFPLFVPPIEKRVEEISGWSAIGLEFIDGAATLNDFLGLSGITSDVDHLFQALFLEGGLRDVYRKSIRRDRPNIAFRSVLTPARTAATLLAMEELGELAKKHSPDKNFEPMLLNKFIVDSRVGDFGERQFEFDTHYCTSHGDLHGRNILVDRHIMPHLIDGGSIFELPWPADIARLLTDLLVSALGAGVESHEWESMEDWLELVSMTVEGRPRDASLVALDATSVCKAIIWIRENLPRVHPETFGSQSEIEFRLAMAVELMRSSYRKDLPSPKRVLGLLGSCLALRSAERLIGS